MPSARPIVQLFPVPGGPAARRFDSTVAVAAAPGGDDVAYCRQKYRSYDVRTGTYLGFDGQRPPCP